MTLPRSLRLAVLAAASLLPAALAAVSLPAIFGDHMVVQQNAELVIWGFAKAGEPIEVRPSWTEEVFTTKAESEGHWRVTVSTPPAGGPHQLRVKGYNELLVDDILAGEVWLGSGQSNMEWTARFGIDNAEQHIAEANYPQIRLFSVEHRTADARQNDLVGRWVVCTPETMTDFSAVAYFFGRELHQTLGVPVGLINSSWGGTPAEVWTVPALIDADPRLAEVAAKMEPVPWGPTRKGLLFNAMIAPMTPFRLAGVIWYQGEGNVGKGETYDELMEALIHGWRLQWAQPDLPFYYAQIAPWNGYGADGDAAAGLMDAQVRALRVPHTGLIPTSDIGNLDDIHPRNKLDVGKRFAALALHEVYGRTTSPSPYAPRPAGLKIEGSSIVLQLAHAKGLHAVDPALPLTGFTVAGEDRQFHPAEATLGKDGRITVRSADVPAPVAVRYDWKNATTPTLFNAAGLPLTTFRTDEWPLP